MTDDRLITELGGPTLLARKLGVKRPQIVSHWRRRGVPAWARPAVLALAKQKGLQLDERAFLRIPEGLAA